MISDPPPDKKIVSLTLDCVPYKFKCCAPFMYYLLIDRVIIFIHPSQTRLSVFN